MVLEVGSLAIKVPALVRAFFLYQKNMVEAEHGRAGL
jgi:hypothetical protein